MPAQRIDRHDMRDVFARHGNARCPQRLEKQGTQADDVFAGACVRALRRLDRARKRDAITRMLGAARRSQRTRASHPPHRHASTAPCDFGRNKKKLGRTKKIAFRTGSGRRRATRIAQREKNDSDFRRRACLSATRSPSADWPCRRSISSPARRTSRASSAWLSPVRPCRDWPR